MIFGRCVALLFSTATLIAVSSGAAPAQEASGTTIAVIPAAAAAGSTGRRVLKVQGPVFTGDKVETGAGGEAQIEFRDNTRLVVGPNSLLTIDSFVFDENNTARKISMNAVKGAFRFITGNSRKQAYAISTPSTTIGIRGTRFDFAVSPSGETTFALFEGEARLCDRAGRCRDIRGACSVAVVPSTGGVEPVRAGAQRAARLRALFPYVVSQARLQPQFRVNTSSCNLRQARLTPEFDPPRDFAPPSQPQLASNPGKPDTKPDPKPSEPTRTKGNPGNGKLVGNAGDKFGRPGTRGSNAKGGKGKRGRL